MIKKIFNAILLFFYRKKKMKNDVVHIDNKAEIEKFKINEIWYKITSEIYYGACGNPNFDIVEFDEITEKAIEYIGGSK